MRRKIRKMLWMLVGMSMFASCGRDVKGDRASGTDIKVARYDRLQFEYATMNSLSALQKMNMDYPQATKLLIEDILLLGEVEEDRINERMLEYFSDTTLQVLMRDAEEKFKDLSRVEEQLTQGFRRLKKEVPSLPVPRVYAQISALNQSVVVTDSLLGFSLDKYMGVDYPLYKRYYYDYQCRSMKPERIVPDCFTFYLISQYPFPWQPGRNLLDMMMHRGKINWVVAHVLKYDSFEEEMGYDKQQAEWCRKNKQSLWQAMLRDGHLHATDPLVVRTYVREDPFIPILGGKAPAGIGVWLGILVVDDYMKTHPDMTVEALLRQTDYRRMLAESGWDLTGESNPKKR